MENVLTIMGAALGILVPFLFAYTLNKGIERSPFGKGQKLYFKKIVATTVVLWTLLVWTFSITGLLSYHVGDNIPRFLFPLFVPVLAGLYLLRNKNFQIILDNTPLSIIAGVQTFRLAGFAFLMIVGLGILPKDFASGGYGDIATGILALMAGLLLSRKRASGKLFFWAFNIVGLLDLFNVAFLLLLYYPIWSNAQPSSAAATEFSLVMIPAIAAPVALLLHFYSIRNALTGNKIPKKEKINSLIEQ